MKRRPRIIDGLDFEHGQAVVMEPDTDWNDRWILWHIRADETDPIGWVRRDWLQGVEQGYEFGDETAVEGFNWFPDEAA